MIATTIITRFSRVNIVFIVVIYIYETTKIEKKKYFAKKEKKHRSTIKTFAKKYYSACNMATTNDIKRNTNENYINGARKPLVKPLRKTLLSGLRWLMWTARHWNVDCPDATRF